MTMTMIMTSIYQPELRTLRLYSTHIHLLLLLFQPYFLVDVVINLIKRTLSYHTVTIHAILHIWYSNNSCIWGRLRYNLFLENKRLVPEIHQHFHSNESPYLLASAIGPITSSIRASLQYVIIRWRYLNEKVVMTICLKSYDVLHSLSSV